MSYQYSQEAKERISALGQTAVVEFIDEIPQDLRRVFYSRLPRVQGFRPGTQAELKEKQKRLIGHLIHPEASQTFDWKNFAFLWEGWARLQFGDTFPQSDNVEPTADAGSTFLKGLVGSFPGAAREDMERLFIFSGFPDHPDVAVALERFRPASDIARDRMIDGLPVRLGEIESRLEVTKATAEDVVERIERLEATSASLAKNVEDASGGLGRSSNAVAELWAALDAESARSDRTEKLVDAIDTAGKKFAEATVVSDARTDALEQSMRALVARVDGWDRVATEVAALKSAITDFSARETDWAVATEAVNVLVERVAALEGILAGGNSGSVTKQRVRLLEHKPNGPFVDIHSIEKACVMVESNLLAAGITKGAAVATARQTVAALIAGQMVQFSGSLADLVADAVAAAIGGPTYHEWRVPVGLVSDEAASDCIEEVAESSGCLLLKGANLSAFEVYGAPVRDIVVRRQFDASSNGRLAVIASWAQGPAVFPNGGTLAELGPVFDTDTLPTRGVSAKLPKLTFGRLMKNSWGQVEGLDNNASKPAAGELGELLKEAGFEGGSLWERIVNLVYATLRAMPGGPLEVDLHSLLVSWAIPWAKATGGPAEEISRIAKRELAERRAEASV
ncbi:hypothetical protein [Chromobacterium violaceum]|uniref:hypothetical protein n=1 Tax=Chromobacterium violaceum TaxID=536 RepID=UPI0005D315FC|nr:hypothetical protein [Chromobacterium violaceum]KJH65672.1 hypothetical protein UF16_20390 [Chromobacterium violaceum]